MGKNVVRACVSHHASNCFRPRPAQVRPASVASPVATMVLGNDENLKVHNLPLCPLAKRIAKPKTTGSIRQQTEATLSHAAYVNVVNLLHHYPNERMAAEKYIMESIADKEREAKLADGCFENVSTVGQLDDAWLMKWISQKSNLGLDLLQKALVYDRRSVNCIFCYMSGCLPTARLPSECISKQFLFFFCDYLWEARGKQLENVKAKAPKLIANTGSVDWSSFAYDMSYDAVAGRVSNIKHRRTGVVVEVEEDIKISSAFTLKDGWSDSLALVTNGKAAKYYLHEFFGPRDGPHESPELRGKAREFDRALNHAQQKMRAAEEAAAVGRVEDDTLAIVDKAAADKKRIRTERARAELLARKEESNKRRRVPIAPKVAK